MTVGRGGKDTMKDNRISVTQKQEDRNKAAASERDKYLDEISRLRGVIRRASERFFDDTWVNSDTASDMLDILQEIELKGKVSEYE